jgi:GT2 family glycosyltransferase
MKRFSQNSKALDLSIIIVSYNTKKLTLQCIKSVLDSVLKLKYEIIVVDNASTDGTLRLIQKSKIKNSHFAKASRDAQKPIIRIIQNNRNLGFAKANNQGIKNSKGKYKLLLNSDTKVKGNAIEKMIEFAEKIPNVGVVGARLINPDGSIQPSVFRLPTIWRAVKQYWLGEKRLLDKYTPNDNKPTEVESLVMAAFLITPLALEKVGLLNNKYFMYFEDLDYCRRVGKVGLKIYYLPPAEVIHYHGASGKSLMDTNEQWRRLIPSSKIYHGFIRHFIFNFILWSGQKWRKIVKL